MKLEYKPAVIKQLTKLSKAEKKKLVRKLELLTQDPYAGKPLKGEFEGLYSLRAWPYRIIYEIGNAIIILSIIHRQSAYKHN